MDEKSQIQSTSDVSNTLPSQSCGRFYFDCVSFNNVNVTPRFKASKSIGLQASFLSLCLSTWHGAPWDCGSMKWPPDIEKIHKYHYNKTNQMHKFSKFTPQFHPGPARQLSTNLYDIYHCWVYREWTPDNGQRNCPKPDNGQRNCPKHVDFHAKINLWN